MLDVCVQGDLDQPGSDPKAKQTIGKLCASSIFTWCEAAVTIRICQLPRKTDGQDLLGQRSKGPRRSAVGLIATFHMQSAASSPAE
eukprot:5323322-Amphidinium_carterae.1